VEELSAEVTRRSQECRQLIDGQWVHRKDSQVTYAATSAVYVVYSVTDNYDVLRFIERDPVIYCARSAARSAAYAVFYATHALRGNDAHLVSCLDTSECRRQAERLRDIFGNPFHPVMFSPAWRTDTAVALAKQMYEWRHFGAMPILADALQDAGCDNDEVLRHCRGAGPHVRGCWVVDLVLGKE
jgi:hypothetical protein